MNLLFRHLETFQLFAQTRSVTETARLMNVTQPAVSQTLKDLENQLGFSIFVRVNGRTRLTEEAIQLLPRVERLLAQANSLKGYAAELRDTRAGQLSVSAIPSLAGSVLPSAMARFRTERRQVRFRFEVHTATEIAVQVKNEHADIGFAFAPVEEPGVVGEPLLRTSLVCFVPKDHPLSKRSFIEVKHLENEVVFAQGQQNQPGLALWERLGGTGESLVALTTNYSIAALNLVRHGLGVGLLNPLVVSFDVANDLVAVPFRPDVPLTLAMIFSRHRPMSRLTSRFVSTVKEVLVSDAGGLKQRNIPYEILI